MTKYFFFVIMLCFFNTSLFAQAENVWVNIEESTIFSAESERQIVPTSYKVVALDFAKMKKILAKAPKWNLAESNSVTKLLSFPMPDGSYQEFEVVSTSVFAEGLAAKYPEIKSYKGWAVNNPAMAIYFDISPQGFHGMVLSNEGTWFIDPYAKSNIENYIVYNKKDLTNSDPFTCLVDEQVSKVIEQDEPEIGDCQFRTYRLALACTGEYAQFHGGTVAGVLAAMNTTMVRVNGVYEREFAINLIIINNNDQIVFLDAATDGYTNNDGTAMLAENQTKIDNIIGTANYDMGHVFSTGGGGIAAVQSPCSGFKAQGVTGRPAPVGDGFDIDYVCHEMGHQFGGHHTQNNDCNRTETTSMEPGSGSSIMGYAGICFPNVQNSSDDYFHAINVQEVHNFITGNGNVCANVTALNNTAPTVTGGLDYSIPIGTPFVLEAVGNDVDGDAITYAWDQMDPEVAAMPPVANSNVGPTFRGFSPTASPKRYFPNLQAILSNTTPTWEVLPSVSRDLNFRVVARDNHPGGGCNAEDDVRVKTIVSAGPFVVTQPNTNVDWPAQSSQTITWDVANTTVAPISAANVDIFLSLDGGATFPIALASNVPNDGSQQVFMPNQTSTTARVMVKASNNIFLDISNTNFNISVAQEGFSLALTDTKVAFCSGNTATTTLAVNSILGYSGDVSLTAENVPTGMTVTFNPSTVTVVGNTTVSISGADPLVGGTYDIVLRGTGTTGTLTETLTVFYGKGAPVAPILFSPTNTTSGASVMPELVWQNDLNVQTYTVELYSDQALNILVASAVVEGTSHYQLTGVLNPSTLYYWRVKALNPCQGGVSSSVFSFMTEAIFCNEMSATDVPIVIPDNATSTKESVISIDDAGEITSIRVNSLNISHSYINDLTVKLIAPDGTEVLLLNQICGSENDLFLSFDDEAPTSYTSIPCPPTGNETYQPSGSLSSLIGKNINGTWTLSVTDKFDADGGQINGWSLDVCYFVESITAVVNESNISCNGANDGAAEVVVAGGATPYTYAWSSGNGTNLSAGDYAVTVTDANSNTLVRNFSILEPSSLVLDGIVTKASPNNSDGKINLTVTGGTPGYSFLWSSNSQTTQNIDQLVAGLYTVTVTDAHGCTAIKQFSVTETCPIPTNLGVEILGSSSVKLNWNSVVGANSYQIEYRVVGATDWIAILVADNFKTLTGLVPSADYEFRIQTHCSAGWSDSSVVTNFSTPASCDAPINMNSISVSSIGATLGWDAMPSATSYMIRYRVLGSTDWLVQSSNTNTIMLSGLESATSYEVIVQSICGSFDSNFNDTFVFTTQMGCSPPTNISVVAESYQSMAISWDVISGVALYSVRYRIQGTTSWSSLNVSENQITIEGLKSGEDYELQIQSKCGVAWSVFSDLTTVTLPAGCEVLAFENTGVSDTTIDLAWSETIGATKYNIVYREVGTTGPWIALVANSTTGVVDGLEPNTTYEIYVQAYCEFGWGSSSSVLIVQTTIVDIQNPTEDISFSYYPNPAKNHLFIEFSKRPVSINIVNMLGQKILSENEVFLKMDLSVNKLKTGLYYIQVKYLDGRLEVSKFVKQ